MRHLFTFFIVTILTWTISCSGRTGRSVTEEKNKSSEVLKEPSPVSIKMKSPEENAEFRIGNPINVILEVSKGNQAPDSVVISFDGRKVVKLSNKPWEYTIPSLANKCTGRKSIKATGYRNGKMQNSVTRFMIILSDTPPKRYGFKVIHTYPHDRDAFTQGLFFDGGVLYEGTGQETSTLREVELESGRVLRQLSLSSNLFGEGITLYNGRIYQLTWTSKVGFVYEKSTFRQINKIFYQTQGWGLTTIKDKLVMSDGSNIIYFMEPELFTVESRLEVYDNEKKVDQLNELEYINGEIWANIWMTDLIARIDPASGKVLGYINLQGILNDRDTDTKVNVLNGIAWDKDTGRIFVTGKNWPRLFEIRVTE